MTGNTRYTQALSTGNTYRSQSVQAPPAGRGFSCQWARQRSTLHLLPTKHFQKVTGVIRNVLLMSGLLVLAGCANPYATSYKSLSDSEYIAANRTAPAPALPVVAYGSNPIQDVQSYYENGYEALGFSMFSDKLSNQQKAVQQGQTVGADLVVYYQPIYQRTDTTAVPLSLPTQQAVSSYSQATAYNNSGGSATAYGSSYGTISGQQWTVVPVSRDTYFQTATYYVKTNQPLGLHFRAPTATEAQALGTQRAVVITAIVRGSAAYQSDFLPGDVILKADNLTVDQIPDSAEFARARRGKTVDVLMVRNGSPMVKKLTMP